MTFNYIIGNPPFQDESNKSKGRKLYLDITKKMLNLYINELIFLTPSTIANDKMKRLSLSNINNLKKIRYDIDGYFDVGIFIIMFHLDRDYNSDVLIINENKKLSKRPPLSSMVQSKDLIPNKLFNKIKIKGSKQANKLFIGDVSSNGFRQNKKSDIYKYKINVNTLKNKVEYTYKVPKLYGKKKIIIHMGMTYNDKNFAVSTENYGQYQNMIDVDSYTDTQINNIKSFLFNEITIKICKKFREFYKTGFNNIIYFFTNDIDINKSYTNSDVIDFFDLSLEELEYLDSKKIAPANKTKDDIIYTDVRHSRVKETAEVFTPTLLVNEMLDELNIDWNKPPQDRTFLDPTCGNGQILVEIAKRGIPVHNIFGLDLMDDNVETTRKRLREIYGDTDDVNFHLSRNIEQGNALTDSYDFFNLQDNQLQNNW